MNATRVAETMQGRTVSWMKEMAAMKRAVVCGSLVIKEKNRFLNRFVWAQPDGQILYYDKRHLFRMAGEHSTYSAGKRRAIIEYMGWRICPQICYDLRFPVWSRNRNDYDLLLYVANWPERRVHAWKTLLTARAIENQCYVAAVNRIGNDGLTQATAFRAPESALLKYQVVGQAKGLNYWASAELAWQQDGQNYDSRLTVSAFLLGSRSQMSKGTLGPEGLMPTRFGDKNRSHANAT